MTDKPIIVALDYDSPEAALALGQRLDPAQCRLKVGKELFTRSGPQLVAQLQQLGFEIFLDLKFHDIPNTVAAAVTAAADLGVWMVNVHASGGREMLQAAREALGNASDRPRLIAVTVLTSMSQAAFEETGHTGPIADHVSRLAGLAYDSGLDGVVCSAQEAQRLQQQLGTDFQLVTPGIRPSWAQADDQKRIMTPTTALAAGSDYLVIGRPITRAGDPLVALQRIVAEIQSA